MPYVDDAHIPELRDGLHQLCSAPLLDEALDHPGSRSQRELLGVPWRCRPDKNVGSPNQAFRARGGVNETWERLGRAQDPQALYPVSRGRGSPTLATFLHKPGNASILDEEMLRLLMAKKAKSPHDLVFACRALFPETFGQIKVDYQRDLADILRELSARIIPRISDLGGFLGLVSLCTRVPGPPSWVLNLQCDVPPDTKSHYFGLWPFTTSQLGVCQAAKILADGKTLALRGRIVDHVALVSDEFPFYSLPNQQRWHKDVHTLLRAWKAACTNGSLKSTFEEAMEYILYAFINSGDSMTAKLYSTARSEGVNVEDDDGTLLIKMMLDNNMHLIESPGGTGDSPLEVQDKARRSAFREWLNNDSSISSFRLDTEDVLSSERAENLMSTSHSPALSNSRLFTTTCGRMVLGRMIQQGDAVALISTCQFPIALRPVPETAKYTLGQPVVLQGVMLGEEWPADCQTGLGTIEII
ncbi:uracil phosphoribosyltransferase-domain-containing protein [Apiospora phragmitis]|uniref:Uracil phosphoribosyltransferase-domain-containing protein n=1 Tax=Apiospora phragmitis TaxID=2905665 RepID=A0ABR1W6D3_9PEZI